MKTNQCRRCKYHIPLNQKRKRKNICNNCSKTKYKKMKGGSKNMRRPTKEDFKQSHRDMLIFKAELIKEGLDIIENWEYNDEETNNTALAELKAQLQQWTKSVEEFESKVMNKV